MEVDERLEQIILNTGGAKYCGTNIIEDQRRVNMDIQRNVKSSDDPFNNYGFGIIAYFKLLQYLLYAYLLICAMAVLLMYIYAKGGTLNHERSGYLA